MQYIYRLIIIKINAPFDHNHRFAGWFLEYTTEFCH